VLDAGGRIGDGGGGFGAGQGAFPVGEAPGEGAVGEFGGEAVEVCSGGLLGLFAFVEGEFPGELDKLKGGLGEAVGDKGEAEGVAGEADAGEAGGGGGVGLSRGEEPGDNPGLDGAFAGGKEVEEGADL
jgi:hypothetical protein